MILILFPFSQSKCIMYSGPESGIITAHGGGFALCHTSQRDTYWQYKSRLTRQKMETDKSGTGLSIVTHWGNRNHVWFVKIWRVRISGPTVVECACLKIHTVPLTTKACYQLPHCTQTLKERYVCPKYSLSLQNTHLYPEKTQFIVNKISRQTKHSSQQNTIYAIVLWSINNVKQYHSRDDVGEETEEL